MTEITIPEKLNEAIKNDNLVLFIGAGFSIPLGYPTWKGLVEEIVQGLDKTYGETSDINFKNILDNLRNGKKTLFEVLNKLENDPDNGIKYKQKSKEIVYKTIDNVSKNLDSKSELHQRIWNITHKVVTTNYDKSIESNLPNNINPKIFDNTNAFQALRSQNIDASFLYKIHGDFDNPETIILFESDYREIYNNDNYNNDSLSTYFKDKTILFIGFSLTDPFVNNLFTKIKNLYKQYTINEHFIVSTKNEDFSNYDVTTIKINDWDNSLENLFEKLENIKYKSNKLIIKKEVLTDSEITNIVELFNKKTTQLKNTPEDKELAKEVRDLQQKVVRLMTSEIDYLQTVNKPFKHNDLQNLFDSIYSSEKLDQHIYERIQAVRLDTLTFKWYDRSVIISAIACSIIHYNKADEKKISLLLDFINDNEEKVWQRALSYLFLSLNHLGNKWLRFNTLKQKIQTLNHNLRIQEGCFNIVQLFCLGLDKVSMINEKLFENPYFGDSPYNYFLPFYKEENPAFEAVYDSFEGDGIEEYIDFIENVTLPDQVKYLLCNKSIESDEINDDKKNESVMLLRHIIELNSIFYPYSSYIQEIINFYKFYPVQKHNAKLNFELRLTETPLKDYLLNEKQKYASLGYYFMKDKKWSQAIVNYLEALRLDENDIDSLLNIAHCYHKNNELHKEFKVREKIKSKQPENEDNLIALWTYNFKEQKDYKKTLGYAQELLKIDNNNDSYYNYRGISYQSLEQYEEGLEDFKKAIEINDKEAMYFSNIAKSYLLVNNTEEALKNINIAINLGDVDDKEYFFRASLFYNEGEYQKAINDLNKAIEINKMISYFIDLAINKLSLRLTNEAYIDLCKAESMEGDKGPLYNTFANYYRLIGNFKKALEYIEKAESLDNKSFYIGTRAAIYSSQEDIDSFYIYLDSALSKGAKAKTFYIDIIEKHKEDPRFISLLQKYNQTI